MSICFYEIPKGTFTVDFHIDHYIIVMRLTRTPTGCSTGYLFVTDLRGTDKTEKFVKTMGKTIPATTENLRRLITIVTNQQKESHRV